MRKMKDSGLEWIVEIPSDWDVTRIGYESWIRARLGWKGLKAEEYVDEGFAFLSAFNIIDDKLQWENLNFINQQRYDESPEIKLKKGDILLVKDGAGIGKCARIDSLPIGAATTNGSLAVISTHAKLSYRYLYFYLLSPIFQNYIYRLMNGMGVPHLSQEELRKIQIPFPPLDEQKKIADFLDGKCADIDQIRADIEKQIEILTDYKKSVITEAVTKGLDPKAKMKDSGIEWIGKIPNGWKTLKVKYLATEPDSLFTDGDWINSDIITEDGVRYLTSGNVGEGYFKKQGDGYISQETFDQLHCLKALPNDLMICRLNLPIGRSCIIPNDEPFYVVAVDNVILRPNHDIDKKFIMYCMNTPGYAAEAEMAAGGTTMKRISRTDLGNLIVPIPSLEEQLAIASYLDEKCSEIDAAITEKQKQLETLEEYKKSLIFEYVTGKKEVV